MAKWALPCAALKLPCPHFSRVLAKTQYVVRSAKRALESPNATLASLKHTCGPRLLEKRKRKSVGGGPQKSCNGLTNTAHYDVIYCLLHRSGQPDADAPSEPVHPAPDPTAGHSMRMDSLADSQGRGRMPPPPKAPSFLLEVIADSLCVVHRIRLTLRTSTPSGFWPRGRSPLCVQWFWMHGPGLLSMASARCLHTFHIYAYIYIYM